jgi:hypothetical protein
MNIFAREAKLLPGRSAGRGNKQDDDIFRELRLSRHINGARGGPCDGSRMKRPAGGSRNPVADIEAGASRAAKLALSGAGIND